MKKCFQALVVAMFVPDLMTPALSVNGGTGVDSVSTSTNYNLDDSTRLQEQIRMYLTADDSFVKTGLTASGALAAITATNTWDDATNQNLFSDSGSILTNAQNWKPRGIQSAWATCITRPNSPRTPRQVMHYYTGVKRTIGNGEEMVSQI